MPYPVPTSLSPSRVESFTSCPLAFRFSSIEKLPEPPSPHATKGTLVHRALELLLTREPGARTAAAAHQDLDRAVEELREDPDFAHLDLTAEAEAEFVADAHVLVDAYLELEDPAAIRPIGLELQLEAQVGGLLMRGIIDRLEEDAEGELVVTDYKTGRSPSVRYEQGRLGGVHFYAYLCEQALGRRPSIIRLMYLRDGIIIEARPTERSVRFLPAIILRSSPTRPASTALPPSAWTPRSRRSVTSSSRMPAAVPPRSSSNPFRAQPATSSRPTDFSPACASSRTRTARSSSPTR